MIPTPQYPRPPTDSVWTPRTYIYIYHSRCDQPFPAPKGKPPSTPSTSRPTGNPPSLRIPTLTPACCSISFRCAASCDRDVLIVMFDLMFDFAAHVGLHRVLLGWTYPSLHIGKWLGGTLWPDRPIMCRWVFSAFLHVFFYLRFVCLIVWNKIGISKTYSHK